MQKPPITITSGLGESSLADGYTGVPGRTLISNLLLMIGSEILKVPYDIDHREELETEFANLKAGTIQPEQSTAHDDVVISVAMVAGGALRYAPELIPIEAPKRENPWQIELQITVPPPAE